MDRGRVYLAARYSRRDEIRAIGIHLKECGFLVTSRWLYEDTPLDGKLTDGTPASHTYTAIKDLEDIMSADTLILFSEDPLVGTPRGGRHFESGYAAGIGKRLVVIGGHENVFHYIPGVLHFPDIQSFIDRECNE